MFMTLVTTRREQQKNTLSSSEWLLLPTEVENNRSINPVPHCFPIMSDFEK